MTTQLEVRSNVTPDDHCSLSKYASLHTRVYRNSLLSSRLISAIVLAGTVQGMRTPFLISFLYRMLGLRPPLEFPMLVLFAVAGWMLGKPIHLWFLGRSVRNQLSGDTGVLGKQLLTIDSEGVRVRLRGAETFVSWSAVSDIEDDAEHISWRRVDGDRPGLPWADAAAALLQGSIDGQLRTDPSNVCSELRCLGASGSGGRLPG